MCNEAARRTALGLMREDFSQVGIELTFPDGAPNLGEAPNIRITDTTVIVRAGSDAAEMVQRRWSWVGAQGKPVYNYRSEGRAFGNAAPGERGGGRCLIPLDGFYEFTDAGPGAKRKDKWLFSFQEPSDSNFSGSGPECPSRELTIPRPAAPDGAARAAPGLFCVAGLWRADVDLGKAGRGEAFTMLTCEPGPDIAPYHSRQIVLMPRDRWADWLGGVVPAADLIAPTPAGTLRVEPAR